MSDQETKRDLMLKRIQVTIGILVGAVTLVVGVYNARNLLFTKKGPGGVTMEVRASNGQPISQASVQVMKVQGGMVASSQTSADGTFGKQGLEPGNYSLTVAKAGFQPEALVFAVEPGRTAELNLRLKPSSSPIGSAVEEVGASWIRKIGTPPPDSDDTNQTSSGN